MKTNNVNLKKRNLESVAGDTLTATNSFEVGVRGDEIPLKVRLPLRQKG